jgi:hypothetical protein
LLLAVRAYQITFAPFLGGLCRFQPSCSCYAAEAIARHGAWHGGALAISRLLRCRPFSVYGFDPVPELRDSNPPGSRLLAPESPDRESMDCRA